MLLNLGLTGVILTVNQKSDLKKLLKIQTQVILIMRLNIWKIIIRKMKTGKPLKTEAEVVEYYILVKEKLKEDREKLLKIAMYPHADMPKGDIIFFQKHITLSEGKIKCMDELFK